MEILMQGTGISHEESFYNYLQNVISYVLRMDNITL